MENRIPPYETRYNDLVGSVSMNLNESFNAFGSALAGYNPERFEAVALRVFVDKTPIITLYALDKERADRENKNGKLPVHKFKTEITLEDFFSRFKQLNFTVTSGEFNIDEMEVINK